MDPKIVEILLFNEMSKKILRFNRTFDKNFYLQNFIKKKRIITYYTNEEFGLATKDGCPKGISNSKNSKKFKKIFIFFNTVLEEQFYFG